LLAVTLEKLAVVMAGLVQLCPDPVSAFDYALPLAEFDEHLNKLKTLLEDSDSEAVEAVDELMRLCGGSPIEATLKPLAKDIGNFDFDNALAKLAELTRDPRGNDS
jgi:hypothetical protein